MRRLLVALAAFVAIPSLAAAQGEITGRVFASDSGRPPIRGVQVSVARLRLDATSDSSGRFRFTDVPPGDYLVVLRAVGFTPESSTVSIDRDEVVSLEKVLTRTTTLPERRVEGAADRTPAHLVEFHERRKAGPGHFLTREQFEKAEGGFRKTGDMIAQVPGVKAQRGSNKVWIASGRTTKSGKCAFCPGRVADLSGMDFAAGARPACFMDVYVNGALAFDGRHPENGLFDANTIPPEHIAGVEVYASAAQVPAKYNRTGASCGVLLIWLR